MSRCGRLRTLVLVLEDLLHEKRSRSDVIELAARLPALAWGAPELRALQLVLPFPEGELGPLWSALEALPNLASLALGWVFLDAQDLPALTGENIADVLDAAQVGPAAPVQCALNTCCDRMVCELVYVRSMLLYQPRIAPPHLDRTLVASLAPATM